MFISPPTHACSLDPLRRRVGCFEIPDFVVLHAVVQPYGTSAIPGHSGHAPSPSSPLPSLPPFRSCPFRCRTIYFGQAGPGRAAGSDDSEQGWGSGANLVDRTGVLSQVIVIYARVYMGRFCNSLKFFGHCQKETKEISQS